MLNGTGSNNLILDNRSSSLLTLASTNGVNGNKAMILQLSAANSSVNVGTGGIAISTVIQDGASASGLTVASGSGTLTLSGTNTFTGGVTINSGTVSVTTDTNLGTAPTTAATNITINGGQLNLTASMTLGATRGIALGGTAGTSISVTGSTNPAIYNGVMSDMAGSTGTLVKQGPGTLQLGGVSTYSGVTAINAGTVQLTAGNDRLPTGTTVFLGQASSNTTGILDLNGFNQTVAGLNTYTATSAPAAKNTITSTNPATLTIAGAGTSSFGDSTTTKNTGIITGAISVVKSGSGTQTFGDLNSYTGTTNITGGTLSVTNLAASAGGNPSGLGSSSNLASNLVLNGGTLQYSGTTSGQPTDRLFTLGSAGGTLDTSGTGGSVNFNGTGSVAFITANTTQTLTLANTNSAANTFGLVLGDNGTGATSLTKTGGGSWTLTVANTYSGTTTVSGGTLALSGGGSFASSKSVVVASGATLDLSGITSGSNFQSTGVAKIASGQTVSGGGTINGAVNFASGSTLAPGSGSAVGTLTFNNALTLSSGATLSVKLNSASAADQVVVSAGSVSLNGSTLNAVLGSGFAPTAADKIVILQDNTGTAIGGTFNGIAQDGTVNLGAYTAQLSYTGSTASAAADNTGHNVVLYNFHPVPEPTTVLAIGAAGLGLGNWLRRRRPRRSSPPEPPGRLLTARPRRAGASGTRPRSGR